MKLFKSKFANRIVIAKTLGFIFGLMGFLLLPIFINEPDMMLRIGILLWYTTLGGILGIFGIMDKHPVFPNWKFPFWFRGIFLGGWMNFVLILFMYDNFSLMLQTTSFAGYSPFWIIMEGAVIGLIIEYCATKFAGEGKELVI